MWRGFLITSSCVVLANAAMAATGFGTKISTVGDWTIYQDKDAMTDALSCTALFHDRAEIQLTANSIAVSLKGRGGVDGYQYRLDDGQPTQMILPTDVEKEIDAIVIQGDEFQRIAAAKRIRFQVLTVLGSMVNEDINLKAAPDVLAVLSGPKCGSGAPAAQ